jgi:hypothetical protein
VDLYDLVDLASEGGCYTFLCVPIFIIVPLPRCCCRSGPVRPG